MKNLKSVTASKRKNIIISIIIITVLCGLLALWFYFNNYSKRYEKPKFESTYSEGKVDIDEKYGYSEMQISDEYKVGVCGAPSANVNGVDLYFSNLEENDVLLKCLLIDSDGNTVGESGLIKPNCYIKTVNFNSPKPVGNYNLTIRVLGFEPETYYSRGVVSLKTNINIE